MRGYLRIIAHYATQSFIERLIKMAVRNFWIKADIDGRKTKLTGGPRHKDGGFDLTIYMRHDGAIIEALEIRGRVHHTREGVDELRLYVEPDNDMAPRLTTRR